MDPGSIDLPDPYRRLRPPGPTPADELCRCADQPPVKLMQALGANPLHCMRCQGEVLPEALPLPSALVDPLADWRAVYDALDHLWLDSGAYEAWAANELARLDSPVNIAGLAVRARIDTVRRCYYWLFERGLLAAGAAAPLAAPLACPGCGDAMSPFVGSRVAQVVCEGCSLVGG